MAVRVLVADDERLFVEALELILATDGRIEVVGSALDGTQAVALARELDPDVVLIDLSMPGVDGSARSTRCSPTIRGAAWSF
jgi:DNA-binding NarL/FixJ family response regulator